MPKRKPPSPAMPEAGTEEFSRLTCEHFMSFVDMLYGLLGENRVKGHCAFAVGTTYLQADGRECLKAQARGNVSVSIKLVASLIDLAAINMAANRAEQTGLPPDHLTALQHVLKQVEKELTTTTRLPEPPITP